MYPFSQLGLLKRAQHAGDVPCEYVHAGDGLALLRVGVDDAQAEAVVAYAGTQEHVFERLPSPGQGAAAFVAPLELVDRHDVKLSLRLRDGETRALPRPVERSAAPQKRGSIAAFARIRRRRARDMSPPQPRSAACEYVDAGGGLALVRVVPAEDAMGDGGELIVDGGDGLARFAPVPQPRVEADGPSLAYAGPLHVLCREGVRLTLRTPDGRELSLPEPIARDDASSDGDVVTAAAAVDWQLAAADNRELVEQLRHRCELTERSLVELRAAHGDVAPSLVKAWRECAELREILDEREGAHRRSMEDVRGLRARAATLELHLDRARKRIGALDGAMRERNRLAAEVRERAAAETRLRRELELASERVGALSSELEQIKGGIAGTREQLDRALRERDHAQTQVHSMTSQLAAATTHAGRLGETLHDRELEVERLARALAAARENGAFAGFALREAKRSHRRLRDAVRHLETDAAVTDTRTPAPIAPGAALRQLFVSVASAADGGNGHRNGNGNGSTAGTALIERLSSTGQRLREQRARRRFAR